MQHGAGQGIMKRTVEKKRGREGFELIVGPGTVNAWRRKEFSSDKVKREVEIARTFCRAINDDFAAHESNNEPFDVEVVSKSMNNLIAGVQLVEAYDDERRRRDTDRQGAMAQLCSDEKIAKSLDGWDILIETATALAPGAESNKVGFQLPIIRDLLTEKVDWSQMEFRVSDQQPYITISGVRRDSAKTGSFRYLWLGGLLPLPGKSLFLKAAESKIKKGYSRSEEPPFWLLIYSLSLTPDARDYRACRELAEKQAVPFDEIFLFDAIGERVYQPSAETGSDELPPEIEGGVGFQLDPSSVSDAGSLDEDNFIEVRLQDTPAP